jgi:hypothetical protein
MAERRRSGGSVATALLVLALVGWLVLRPAADASPELGGEPASAAAGADSAPVLAGAGPAAAASGRTPVEAESLREPTRSGIDCEVLGPDGAPLAHAVVRLIVPRGAAPSRPRVDMPALLRRDAPAFPSPLPAATREAKSDGQGRCAFDDLAAGDYTLALYEGLPTTTLVPVPAGARVSAVLQVDPSRAMVFGQVATDASQWRMRCEGAGLDHSQRAAEFRFVCPPGVRTLSIELLGPGQLGAGGGRLAERRFEVAAGTQLDLGVIAAPVGRVLPTFVDPRCRAVGGHELVFERGLPSGGFGAAQAVPWADEFELVPGRYRCHVDPERVLGSEPIEFELGPNQRLRLEFSGEPTAVVHLHLLDQNGQRLWPGTTPLRLSTARGELPLQHLDGGRRNAGTASRQFGFLGVPLGPASLRAQDEVGEQTVSYLPFEPPAPTTLDVQPGDRNHIELRVVHRPRVRLRAADRAGVEQITARIQVFDGVREVASVAPRPSQWEARLPVGEYRLVVTRPDGVRPMPLRVGPAGVELTLRP